MAEPERRRDLNHRLGEPLQNPIRRRIMRVLHHRPEERSAAEVALETGEELALVNYHLRSLVAAGVVSQRQEAGAVAKFSSAVIGVPKVLALLEVTKADDERRAA